MIGPGPGAPVWKSASACGRRGRRGSGYVDVYPPVQGPGG
jgi:hypothetical protein